MIGLQLFNIFLIVLAAVGFAMFIIVLFKLNKALTIWLKKK